ncbi:hypothetical protein PpBr36_04248 [Pyricularia pennisetigena]|uniref:hypothetical protein n=1 Tax=Pyricularia pennisetigena TaxID=1578925 RepID=UPI001151084E|nr:hypothetical protein PpBr36_04248 [Pyricularia pennisetigena]TLS26421.1 hypothetical protein PpBr36_04248 [Pyricularia pennisetigena]
MKAVPKRRACDSCSKRKIKCDGREPRCDYCQYHDLPCTFVLLRKRIERAKARKEAEHRKFVDRLDAFSRTLADEPTWIPDKPGASAEQHLSLPASGPPHSRFGASASLPKSHDHPSQFFCKFHFAGYEVGYISSRSGLPMFSPSGLGWIESRTGQNCSFPALDAQDNPSPLCSLTGANTLLSTIQLPAQEVVEEQLATYYNSPIWLVYPVVDRSNFSRTIAAAYQPQGQLDASYQDEARMCVLSFLCMSSVFIPSPGLTPVTTEPYALQVQNGLPQMLVGSSIHLVQICLMQAIYHLFSRDCEVAFLFHSVACRTLFTMGAHREGIDCLSPSPPHETEDAWRWKCYLRQCFWILYVLDKDLALRLRQPPSISDEHCDLTLPDGYKSGLGSEWDHAGKPHFPGDLRLSIIKSKAVQHLHSHSAIQKSDAELLRDIRELDDELEAWRLSIKPEFRPRLCNGGKDYMPSDTPDPSRMMQFIITNLEYRHLVATIHQATGRCRSGTTHGSETLKGVNSSVAICVEASRSTLMFLATPGRNMPADAFWMVIFYPVQATVRVFLNILLQPRDPQCQEDLKLLRMTSEAIRNIENPGTHTARNYISSIVSFVEETVKLATCAIENSAQTN